jgi:Uma2 family endonuclease
MATSRAELERRLTVGAYLEMERAAEDRHEFIDGIIYEMAGESPAHADISTNLIASLHNQLLNSPCRVRAKDTKILTGLVSPKRTKGMFSYPDIVIICDEPQYHDHRRDILLNPSVIIEVLSEGTELFDRSEKFKRYRDWLPSLTDYILVSQSAPLIEHFTRKEGPIWELHPVSGLDSEVGIPSLNCSLKLSDVYFRVEFPPTEAETEDEE